MKHENFDSLQSMSDEEKLTLYNIQKIRRNIKHFIGNERIINTIIDTINESIYFNDTYMKNKNNININKPLIILEPNINEIIKKNELKYINEDKSTYFIDNKINPLYNDDINLLQELVHTEIIQPVSDYIMSYVKDENKFKELLKERGIDLKPEYMKLLNLTANTILFAIKCDILNNKIYVEMII